MSALDADVLSHMADEHVFYEMRGVVYFAQMAPRVRLEFVSEARNGLREEIAQWVGSSLLEAGLVHVRCVVEFLTGGVPDPKSSRSTDVVASHYSAEEPVIGERYREYVLGTSREHQQELLSEIHQRVMHLTTRRATVADEGPFVWWDYIVEQVPAVLAAMREFLDELGHVSPDRFLWFRRSDELLREAGYP